MRRLKFGIGIKAIAATIIVSALLFVAGCTLVQPGCRNRDVKASIEKDARESIDVWLTLSKQQELPGETQVRLVEPVEVSRKDATRACTAKIAVGSGEKQLDVPIEYEVIAGDGAQGFYRWNKEEFGKTFIDTSLFSLLPSLLQKPTSKRVSADSATPQHDASADPSPSIDSSGEPEPEAPFTRPAFENWHDNVTGAIKAQSPNVRIEGSGSVSINFMISPTGLLSDIRISKSSGNAGLDKAALQMVEKTARVRPPLDHRSTAFSMKLSFL